MLLTFQPEILFCIFFFCGQSCVEKINILDFVALQKNKVLYDLVKDVIAETQGELENLTKTTAINQSYKDALDKVFLQATTGLETYDKATERSPRIAAKRPDFKDLGRRRTFERGQSKPSISRAC